jgi:hypothetical protein
MQMRGPRQPFCNDPRNPSSKTNLIPAQPALQSAQRGRSIFSAQCPAALDQRETAAIGRRREYCGI